MSLSPGSRLGAYEVIAKLGEGGMGEVYRGRDTRLGREVAIKILPEQFASDRERVARFEREARTLASLNHPHIAQIYGLEHSGSAAALVMELVAGEDLSQRISQGPIPLDEALAIARQIADALDAAHGQGIVHRDLKPANVKVRDDGTVKVLDFGLAKPVEGPAAPSGATITSPAMSMPGVILGTAAYMAPEQAKGRPVDKRADIWAFGCVLYEMVTGCRAFAGEDISETIASILRSEPNWAEVPAPIEPLLVSCLQKDPRQRLRDIGDVTLLLDRAPAGTAARATASRSIANMVLAAVSIAALLASGVMLWRARPGAADPAPPARMTLNFPESAPMQVGAPQPSLAVSPDGRTIAYTALGPEGVQLWTHSIAAFEPQPLAGTVGARNVFFSPDGRHLAFFSNNQLKRMPVAGGTVTVVCEVRTAYGGTWTTRGEIVFTAAPGGALWIVPASGGEPRQIAAGPLAYPDALPGGGLVVATDSGPSARTSSELNIVTVDLDSGEVRPLIAGGTYARYAASGHVLFLRHGAIMAAALDTAARTASDQPAQVVTDVFQNPSLISGNYAVSAAGTLAYAPGSAADFNRGLLLIDSKGQRTAVSDDRLYFDSPRVSPDGQRIAVTVPGWHDSIWVFDRVRGALTELTTGDMNGVAPVWTPDGRRIAFSSQGNSLARNLHWMAADGTGAAERLTTSEYVQRPNAWTPDGRTLIFTETWPEGTDLMTLTLGDRPTTRPLLASRFREGNAALSPDGRWMAYTSNRSGRPEVYLTPFPAVDRHFQVSTASGRAAAWSRDGRRLYYRTVGDDDIMAVDVTLGVSPVLSRPIAIARLPRADVAVGAFDVTPDGRLLVVDDESAGGTAAQLRIVVNWFTELNRK